MLAKLKNPPIVSPNPFEDPIPVQQAMIKDRDLCVLFPEPFPIDVNFHYLKFRERYVNGLSGATRIWKSINGAISSDAVGILWEIFLKICYAASALWVERGAPSDTIEESFCPLFSGVPNYIAAPC